MTREQVGLQRADRPDTEQRHGPPDLGRQYLDGAHHTVFPGGGKAIEERAPQQDGICAERQRLHDFCPAPKAGIDEDRKIRPGQGPGAFDKEKRGCGPVELTVAVVRQDHAVQLCVDCDPQVIDVLDALCKQLPLPRLSDLGHG